MTHCDYDKTVNTVKKKKKDQMGFSSGYHTVKTEDPLFLLALFCVVLSQHLHEYHMDNNILI